MKQILYPSINPKEAFIVLQEELAEEFGKIAEMTGTKPPTTSQLQSAVKRLSRMSVIDREKKRTPWTLSDPLRAAWIRARPDYD